MNSNVNTFPKNNQSSSILTHAFEYLLEGLNPIPLWMNKAPMLEKGHPYLYQLVPEVNLEHLFTRAEKIGVVCGDVSSGFECIDFDAKAGEPIDEIFHMIMSDPTANMIIKRNKLPVVKTPSGGYHIYYRHTERKQASRVLAYWETGKVMIETRGNGAYVATIPSEGYEQLQGSSLTEIARITEEERDYLFSLAESLTRFIKSKSEYTTNGKWPDKFDINTVWGRYNENEVDEAKNLLIENGWRCIRERRDGVQYWQRPGKPDGDTSTSATFGRFRNMFYCFTDNAAGFEKEKAYTLFDIFIIYKHGGDRKKAIQELEIRYGIQHYKLDIQHEEAPTNDHNHNEPDLVSDASPLITTDSVSPPDTSISKTSLIPPFPIDGLPVLLQRLILECSSVYGTPRDFWAASFFVASASAIGLSFILTGKYTNITALWWMFVAPSGTGKSEPLHFAINPLNKIDAENFKSYKREKADFDSIKNMTKSEKKDQDIHELPPIPICKQIILRDFTPESMAEVHNNNLRGILMYRDEIMGWINDIGRYAKSGEVETMLSTWSGMGTTINRKGQDPIRIDEPCITIAGGVQVKKLDDLSKEGRADNGMIQRCMFVWPVSFEKSHYKKETVSLESKQAYEQYINNLRGLSDGNSFILSDVAEVIYEEFYNQNADKSNAVKVEFLKELYAKLDIIALRLALIIQVMKLVCEGNASNNIEPDTMEYAIRITEYFRATGLKVYHYLSSGTSTELSKKDVILFLRDTIGITNQSDIARFLKVSQQYVNKTFAGSL
ncbi:MAG: DUF3987 domain-containing protein [Alphaproteobacteria bacterium]|nr:DUF3987 domain-containing protein [Alphaproteobacteria bacterium]